MFANYTDFRSAFLRLIDGDNIGSGAISPETADLLIAMGERRVYDGDAMTPGLRSHDLLGALPVVVVNGRIAIPDDLLALHSLNGREVEVVPLAKWCEGRVAYDGDQIIVSDDVTEGRYYARPVPMKDTWVPLVYPLLHLYACLYEAALFLGMDGMTWEKRYRELAVAANSAERHRVYDGSRLRVRLG